MDNFFSKRLLIAPTAVLISVSFIYGFNYFKNDNSKIFDRYGGKREISIGQTIFNVDVVFDSKSRAKGLGGRQTLSPFDAMLFVFDEPNYYNIWMKDMLFPIDILWISKGHRVVSIKENALPSSYPEVFAPSERVLYILEAPTGFARENEVKIGSEIIF